ncbi:MAG TPA: CRTAC1 family protein [Bryobacteraceae bacterium]|nr:CRTAC1 family protein [Bryobacteraceae bacterium]
MSAPRAARRAGNLAGACLICVALAVAAEQTIAQSWFQDVTNSAGVNARHSNRVFDNPYAKIMEGYTALGASATVADYDGDGYDDVFVTDSKLGGKNHLYHNNHNFTFTDVAEAAGVADSNDASDAVADSLWFDFNNDGKPDLFVVRFGHNQLFQNMGNGKFKDVSKQAGIDSYKNAITAIAFDYDRDGKLDLFVGAYFQPINIFKPESPRFFPESFETANNGGGVSVYHNNGDGTFTDVTEKVGLGTRDENGKFHRLSGWTLDLGHADADNDGFDDLYVACDFGTDHFFHNNGDGTFSDITEKAIGIDTKKGMNVDWGDFDNDGLLDIYVTNITDDYMREGNFLWHNNGNLTFSDVSRETGTAETGWGWGAKFFDYDNDGWLDIYVTNGWVSAGKDSYVPDVFKMVTTPNIDFADARNWPPMGDKSLSGYEKKKLFHNEKGQIFKDEARRHGVDSIRDGRGVAIADFDNDGRLDMFVANANGEPYLYRNTEPTSNHWVQFALEGTKSNKTAVGAQVRLKAGGMTRLQFISGGNSFAGQSSNRVHFGLGEVAKVDQIEVRWPAGEREVFSVPAVDKIQKIVEGSGKRK